MGFSFRTSDQYGVDDYILWESRWQQLARLSGQELPVWTETFVASGGVRTYPFPGEVKLAKDEAFRTQDLDLVDPVDGGYVSRDSARTRYEDPRLDAPKQSRVNASYTVIS